METYDLVDALQAHQGQRHSKSSRQTSETNLIRDKPHYGIFHFSAALLTKTVSNGPYRLFFLLMGWSNVSQAKVPLVSPCSKWNA